MKNAQRFSRGLRDARRSYSALGPCPGARVVVVAMVMVVVVMVPLAPTEASAERTGKRRKVAAVEAVECGCGAELSRELLVEPTADKDCARSKLRRPHELRGEGIQHYPLRTKVRRTNEGSEIHLAWRLSYIPHKKRSRLSEFHILFVTTVTRKNRKARENGQCFRVTGLRRVCKKKVICKAKYPKSRPRGLSLQVLYRYRKSQKVRSQLASIMSKRSAVSYVLKTSLARKPKKPRGLRRSYRSGQLQQLKKRRRGRNPRHNRTNRQLGNQGPSGPVSCVAWVPTVRLSTQDQRVTVDISPVNPFASELELALHYAGSSLQINPTRIPARVKSYTFTDVTNGIYVVSLRPIGPKCAHAQFIYSRTSVNVTGGNQEAENHESNDQPYTSCADWIPKVTVSSSGRSVTVHYSPPNLLASSLEIALQRPGSSLQLYPQHILNNVTTYTFVNVELGDYRMSIRALGDECRGAIYIFSRDIVTVNGVVPPEPPICSHWKPSFRARMTNHSSNWCLVEVDIDIPPNLAARKLEVALQEPDTEQIVKLHTIGLNQTSAVFNVTMGKNEMYKALVRPCGCTDCKDYELNREECFLPFTKANISASSHTKSPPPPPTTTTTTATTTITTTTTTATTTTTTTGKATATTIIDTPNMTWAETNATNPARIHTYLLVTLPVAVVTIAVVVVGVTLLLGNFCRRRSNDRPEDAEADDEDDTIVKQAVPHAPSQSTSLAQENSETNCKHLSHCPSETDPLCADSEDTVVKRLIPPSPSQDPPPNSYLLDHERQHLRRRLLQPPCPANRVLIVHECRTENDKAILKLFLEVIKCLPHVQVKVDFACRQENERNVEEWVSCVLRSCSRVVVVLSDSFLRVCQSYAGSRTLQVTSPSAYTDIAPLVMQTLAGEDFGRAIFVHFGINSARQLHRQLLDLWLSPQNYRLMENHSSVLDIGQPASLGVLYEGRACEEPRLDPRLFGPRSLSIGNANADFEGCHGNVQAECDEESSSVFLNSADIGSACCSLPEGGLPVPADAPPAYSPIDPNPPTAAVCGSHAGRFNSGTNTSVFSCQARGTVVRPPASLVGRNPVPRAQPRTRHVSAPAKSNSVRQSRLPDRGWYPNSRYPSAANCCSPHHNPCGCETSKKTVAFAAPSALAHSAGAESLSARLSTASTEHALLSEHGCESGLGHGVSGRHNSVSTGNRASHVCSCQGGSASDCGVSSSPSSAGGLISLRTDEGLRLLLWLLCPNEEVILPILSSSTVQTFLNALLDDDFQPD